MNFKKLFIFSTLSLFLNPVYAEQIDLFKQHVPANKIVFKETVHDKKVKDVVSQRLDTSCGGASLAMLFQNSMNMSVLEDDVVNFVIQKRGHEFDSVNFNDMMEFANLKDTNGLAQFISIDGMKNLTKRNIPFIVRIKSSNLEKVNSEEDRFLYHFVVVKGFKNGLVSISDPALEVGNVQYTEKEFVSMIDIEDGKGKVFFLLPKENSNKKLNKEYIEQPEYYPFKNKIPNSFRF